MQNKIKTIACFITSFLFFVNCRTDKKNVREMDVNNNIHIIDVKEIKIEERILLSEFFSTVKTIILETRDDILLGDINTMQIFDNKIFVLDRQQNVGVFVFDKEGKFIRKFGNKGIGPGEYINVSDFTIDSENDVIYMFDDMTNKMLKYKISTGKFENSIELDNIYSSHIQYGNGRLYTDAHYADDVKNGEMIREIDLQSGKQKSCWLDFLQYNCGWKGALGRENESLFYSRNQNSFKFVHFFMDTIITFQKDGPKPFLVLKDDNWVSPDDVLQIQKDEKEMGFTGIFNKDVAFDIHSYVEWGDFICFSYQKKHNFYFVLYNAKTKATRIATLLINDLAYDAPMLVNSFGCTDSTGVYEVVNSYRMMRLVERAKEDDFFNADLDKIEELKNLTYDANPVIFYYE